MAKYFKYSIRTKLANYFGNVIHFIALSIVLSTIRIHKRLAVYLNLGTFKKDHKLVRINM